MAQANAKQYALQSCFNGGEVSPRILGQIDLKYYRASCQIAENWLLYLHGPAHTRPGYLYADTLKDSTKKGRLVPFIYSTVQAYMLVLEEGLFRVISDQSLIIDPATSLPLEVVTPYAEADLPFLKFAQSFDIKYLVARNYPPMKLERYAETDWRIPEVDFPDGPYRDINIDGATHLYASAISGDGVTLTATSRSDPTTIGTADDTPDTAEAAFAGSSTAYVGFMFTTTEACQINGCSIFVDTAPGAEITVAAFVYSNKVISGPANAPNALLASSAVQTITDAGEYIWTFLIPPEIAIGTICWIVYHATSTNADTTLSCVAADSGYASCVDSAVSGLSTTAPLAAKDFKSTVITSTGVVANVFDPGHIGSVWRLKHSGDGITQKFAVGSGGGVVGHILFKMGITTTTATGKASPPLLLRGKFVVDCDPVVPGSGGGNYWDGEVTLQNSTDQVNWYDVASFFYSTTQNFFEADSNVYYRLYCKRATAGSTTISITQAEHWGTIRITGYTSPSVVTGDVLFPFASTDPTAFWREGAWSYYRGYPEGVVFHDNRLWFCRDVMVWGSWVGDFENFTPDGDTDASAVTFSPTQVNSSLVWMESLRGLMIGSIGEEGRLTGSNEKPITQSSIQCEVQTGTGSAQYPAPIRIGQAALFIQSDRRKIREFVYNLEADGFKAPDLTTRAEHITAGGVFDASYQKNPNSIAFFTRGDGVLLGLTYYRDEDVVGWHRQVTDGLFESCAVKPSAVGVLQGYDELWAIVNRTIGGKTVRCIETMANHEPTSAEARTITEFLCLDCATIFTAPDSLTLTGLDRFEGDTVTVVADGTPLDGPYTVASGSITLDLETIPSVVHVGLPFECTLITMPFDSTFRDGASVGRNKLSYQLVLRLLDSLGGKVGPTLDALRDIVYRKPVNLTDQQVPLQTGVFQIPYNGNTVDMSLCVVQPLPLPLTVVAAGLLIEICD